MSNLPHLSLGYNKVNVLSSYKDDWPRNSEILPFHNFPRTNTNSDLEKRQKYVYISSTPFPELAFTCRHVTVRWGWSLLRDNIHGFTQTGQKASNFFVFQPQPQPQTKYYARDDVLIATTIRIGIFWDVTPCSLITIHVSEQHTASMFRIKDKPLWRIGWIRLRSRYWCWWLTHWGRGHLNCLNARSRGF
jgi:hypothetical protein